MKLIDITTRNIRGYAWIRAVLGRFDNPGHGWLNRGLVRRDTFTIKGWGLALLAMPISWPKGCDKCEREWPAPAEDPGQLRQDAIAIVAARLAERADSDPNSWIDTYDARRAVDALLHEPELLRRLARGGGYG